jgi:ketosteroid isomerase-like protein
MQESGPNGSLHSLNGIPLWHWRGIRQSCSLRYAVGSRFNCSQKSFESIGLYTGGVQTKKTSPEQPKVPVKRDIQKITKLFKDGDRALIAGDITEIRRIYAGDYIQYDECGNRLKKQNLIRNLTSGKIRFISMKSTARYVRLLSKDFAVVHGAEKDVIEQNGKQREVIYIYTDVVAKRSGKWQIVISQLAKPEVGAL